MLVACFGCVSLYFSKRNLIYVKLTWIWHFLYCFFLCSLSA